VVVVGRLELATEEHFARMLYGKMLSPGPRVTGTCSYGCCASRCPDAESSAVVVSEALDGRLPRWPVGALSDALARPCDGRRWYLLGNIAGRRQGTRLLFGFEPVWTCDDVGDRGDEDQAQ
jgi:hypothetical protein